MANKFQNVLKWKAEGTQKTASDVNKIGKASKSVEKEVGKLLKKFAGFAGATIAIKKVIDVGKKMADLAIKQEQIFRNLETAITLQGGAYDKDREAIDKLFASQQALTKYGDTDSAEMLTKLINFSGDYENSLKYLALAQDIASAGMFDTSSAARYVGLALAGNTEMLGRYIPELKAGSKEMEGLVTKEEKVAKAMEILNDRFGGTAQKNMDATASKIQRMKNYWGDYQEMLGDKVLPTAGKAADAVAEFFARATETDLDTTIRQLKEMGAEMGDIEALVLTNNLLKADEALEQAGNQFDKFARKARKVSDAISKEDGVFTIDTEKAREDVKALTDESVDYGNEIVRLQALLKKQQEAVDNYTGSKVMERNALILAKQETEDSILGYQESIRQNDKNRESILKAILAYENLTAQQNAYSTALTKFEVEGSKAYKSLVEYSNEMRGTSGLVKDGKTHTDDYSVAMGELDEVVVDTNMDLSDTSGYVKKLNITFDEGIESISNYLGYFNDLIDIAYDYKEKILEIRESELETTLEGIRATEDYQNASLERRAELEKSTLKELNEVRLEMFMEEKNRKEQELAMATNLAIIQSLGRGDYAGALAIFGLGFVEQITSNISGMKELKSMLDSMGYDKIPEYAGGGIARYPQLAMVGDSGIEGILNPRATSELGIDAINSLNAGASLNSVMPTSYVSNPTNVSTINKTSNKPVYATINVINNNPLFLDDRSVKAISDKIERQSKNGLNNIMVKYN